MPNRDEDNPYATRFINDAPRVGTNTFQRNMADELARERERNRIQRQTVSASYAQQYEQARGNMMRGQMAGAAPGLTGGLAQQRTSEISGAQMRGLSQLSGQREQALREVDYQGLMANRQAFDFAQQQTMAQRDEQMFNLNMIQSRQGILDSDMSDDDKREALANTGLTAAQIDAQIADKNKGLFDRFRDGDWGFAQYATLGGAGAAVGGTALQTAAAMKSGGPLTLQPVGKVLGTVGRGWNLQAGTLGATNKIAISNTGLKAGAALKQTTIGKGITGIFAKKAAASAGTKGLMAVAGVAGFKFIAAAAIIAGTAMAIKGTYDYFKNKS